jgi:hypothetical protein
LGDFEQESFNDSLPFAKVFKGNTFVGQVSLVLLNNNKQKEYAHDNFDSPSFVPWEGGVHDKQIPFQDKEQKEWTECSEMSSYKSEVIS